MHVNRARDSRHCRKQKGVKRRMAPHGLAGIIGCRKEPEKQERRQKMKTMRVAREVRKVLLALLCGVLMPVLMWVALGAAITWKAREKTAKRVTVRRIGEVLATTRR